MAYGTSSSAFLMHSSRAAVEAGLFHVEEHVKAIELAVADKPGLVFDLARTLIESACRTILTDRGIKYDTGDDLPKLFKTATGHLPLLPPSASDKKEIRKSLIQTLGGLSMAVQGICELRNACGFASHGSDGPRPQMEIAQAMLAAGTADAIVGFLYRLHRQDRMQSATQPQRYEDHNEFNEYVDEMHGRVQIFDEEFESSRILFEMAPEAYRIYLADFDLEADIDETHKEVADPPEATP